MSQNTFADSIRMTAKTLPGLEEVLAEELTALGAQDVQPQRLAVIFRGSQELLYRANLCLRTALRVLVPLREFHADKTQQIYDAAYSFPWETYIGPDDSLAVDTAVSSHTFTHGDYCALKVKDAVCDRFTQKSGRRPSVDTETPALRINLWIHDEDCVLSLDSSGDSLHRRGYRLEKTEAPLSEVLAAGILRLSGWDASLPLHDPMCGSGTFLTEAGLMAARIPPGALRKKFGFMGWKTYSPELWKKVRDAEFSLRRDFPAPITGADSDPKAVEIARSNIRRAGLEGAVSLERAVFEDASPPPQGPGIIVMNPPYGKRMKDPRGRWDSQDSRRREDADAPAADEINELYTRIGDTFKRKYTGWTAWIFSANLEAIKRIGLRPFRRVPLKNGPLECRLLGFKLF